MQNTSSKPQTLLTKCIICQVDIGNEKLVQNPRGLRSLGLLELTKNVDALKVNQSMLQHGKIRKRI